MFLLGEVNVGAFRGNKKFIYDTFIRRDFFMAFILSRSSEG